MHSIAVHLYVILLLLCCTLSLSSPHTQYLATVHHSPVEYKLSKRNMHQSRFIGDLIYNNTVNENGEVTISLCDITKDLFGSLPSLLLFDLDESAGVDNIATAELKAKLQANLQIDGCLVFFFNPCCKTLGFRIELDDPIILSAKGSLQVELEAFSLGVKIGSNDIDINPLNNIDLSGFSPVIGSWSLPPIMDRVADFFNHKFCAPLSIPGTQIGLDFCVVLANFTASVYGVNVCPRLTISFGGAVLFDISYAAVAPGMSECLTLSFYPTCSWEGSNISPDIVQLFKSADADNNQIMTLVEMLRALALMGSIGDASTYSKMDTDKDGKVHFSEFQAYATVQADTFDQSPSPSGHKGYSGGEIAAAVLGTMFATIIAFAAILLAIAQYKGIIDIRKRLH